MIAPTTDLMLEVLKEGARSNEGTLNPEAARRSTHYYFLDGIRGITAFYVMVYHLLAWVPSELPRWLTRLQRPLSFGHVAVSIFIVLSGFSLGLPVARSQLLTLRGGIRSYFVRRARRILPAYYAATIVAIVVAIILGQHTDPGSTPRDVSQTSILLHVVLLQNLFREYESTINMAHWSVAAEWQIYFIFPLMLLPVWRRCGRVATYALSVILAATPLLLLPKSYNLSWTCPWYVALFATGLIASTFEQRHISSLKSSCLFLTMVALGGAYLLVHHKYYRVDVERPFVDMAKDTIAGTVVAGILVYGTSLNLGPRTLTLFRLLETLPCRLLGRISYSLYLVHCTVLSVCLYMAARYHFTPTSGFYVRTGFGIPASLGLATVFYIMFERPFQIR